MPRTSSSRLWAHPARVWLVVLALIFAAEYAVMQVLPLVLPEPHSRVLESAVDAVVLTTLLAPVFWWALVRPLQEALRLRKRFLVDLFAQIETDRRQTAHELHDGVGQSLTLLVSGLRSSSCSHVNPECKERRQELQRLAEDALLDIKRLALGLRPSLLDDLGLAPALERLVADVRVHHPIELSLNVAEVDGLKLSDQVATAVFRIVQEALANVMRHSGARQAAVTVRHADGHVAVEVTDDGCGIAPDRLDNLPPGHLGLTGMRERATLLGGRFSIESAPRRGTRILAAIPTQGTTDE